MLNSPFVPLVLPTLAEISRNGVFKIAPFFTILIRPACSTTNNRLLPSCADARSVGCLNPAVGLPKEMAGQLCPLTDALTQPSARITAVNLYWKAIRGPLPRNRTDLSNCLASLTGDCSTRDLPMDRISCASRVPNL